MTTEQEVLRILESVGAIIVDEHIVYTSGKHGSAYVNKDAVYPYTKATFDLCQIIAEHFEDHNIEVVIGPAIGAVILSRNVADILTDLTGDQVLSVYAEKNEEGGFVIKRGYDKIVVGRRVLVVEDVLTTGGSAKKVIEATRSAGGEVVGLGVLCNRGGITPKDVANVPELFALLNIAMDAWPEDECPLCAKGVPINTDVGKGREFLARRRKRQEEAWDSPLTLM